MCASVQIRLSSAVSVSNRSERAAGDRDAVQLSDQQAAVGRRELRGRDRLTTLMTRLRRAFVALAYSTASSSSSGCASGSSGRHRQETQLRRLGCGLGWGITYIV